MAISTETLFQRTKEIKLTSPFLLDFEQCFPEGDLYLVGGAVRDLLLSRRTKDIDFLIRNVASAPLHRFLSQHGKASLVGKNFGVYKFMPAGSNVEIDVALPRTERSFSHKGIYRDFEIETDPSLPIEEDLKRRDFTINAMAVDMKRLSLIDPFDGRSDLEAGLIRAVGDPEVRFSEDYSRLLRGLRLACQFHFQFEKKTWNALREKISLINSKKEDGTFVVPRETIAKELLRALVYDPMRMFDLWDESGAFLKLIPELLKMKGCPQPPQFHSEGDVWTHTRLALNQLTSPLFREEFQIDNGRDADGGGDEVEGLFDAEVALSVLLHDVGKPYTIQTPEKDGVDRIRFNNHDHVGANLARELVSRLKLSSLPKGTRYYVDEDALSWLIQKHLILVHGEVNTMRASTIEKYFLRPDSLGRKLMQVIFCDGNATIPPQTSSRPSQVPEMRHYAQLKERLERIKALGRNKSELPPPLLSGKDVMAVLGIPSGPNVGKYLALLREEQLSGRLKDRDAAMVFLSTTSL